MTKQEIFNIVCDHLIEQNSKSLNKTHTMCAYRGSDGKKCAVGCLVTDDECFGWDDWDATGIKELARECVIPERLVPHVTFLFDLQVLHDGNPPIRWKSLLREVADRYSLRKPASISS